MAYEFESDNSTFAANVIDYAHHEIHAGSHFFLREVTNLVNSASRELVLITPDTEKWCHLEFEIFSEGEVSLVMTEAPTVVGGTVITTFNRNRNSAKTPTMVVKHTPSSATGGTIITQNQIGSGQKIGGESRDLNEVVLKQNTTYTLVVSNETSVSNLCNIVLSWYEHEDKV